MTKIRPVRRHLVRNHGFSLPELMVVIGMIGVFAVVAMPVFVNFLQAQRTRGAAQELVSLLNQARQLAISTNSRYRVEINTADTGANRLCFKQSTDGGANYSVCLVGPGTDGGGLRSLENQAVLSKSDASFNPTFNHLGAANTGTITVQDVSSSSSLGVVIAATGRIRICPPNCP